MSPWGHEQKFADAFGCDRLACPSGDRFFRDDRALRLENIGELAPDMGRAGDFMDIAGAVEVVEPGIAVRVHPALVPGQMCCRMGVA